MKNMSKNIINAVTKKPLLILVAVLVIGGILLLIFGGSGEKSKEDDGFQNLDPAKYARDVEERVEALCNRVDGAGSAYAVVTLEGGYRAIYATDSQSSGNGYKNEMVIMGNGSSSHGLLIGYENPRIVGIVIVCSGGDNYNVRKNIISVVSSAFDIPSNKIFVSGT